MNDELQYLRDFRADVPEPTEEVRRSIYDRAVAGTGRGQGRGRLHLPLSRRVKWYGTMGIAVAAAGTAAFLATSGGAAVSRAQGVSDVVSQVQSAFGDNAVASASVNGSTLSSQLSGSAPASRARGMFEAQVLAHVAADWMTANNQSPVTALIYQDASGGVLPGTAVYGDPVGPDPNAASLPASSCQSAAQGTDAAAQASQISLTAESVRTIPLLDGICVLQFQTSDPSGFAASASTTLKLNGLDVNEHPVLVEVDDDNGAPQFVTSSVPGFGVTTWIRPGLSNSFEVGPPVAATGP
jgi:hypothetical protein